MTALLFLALALSGADRLELHPLRFESSSGAFPYVARGQGYWMGLTAGGHELILPDKRISTRWIGANPAAPLAGEAPLAARVHYFRGDSHRTAIAYSAVRVRGVYRGIDLLFHGRGGQFEYDFVLAPGADPAQIAFEIDGASDRGVPRLTESGDLKLGDGIAWKRPEVYQDSATGRRRIDGRFVVDGHRVRFALGAYDRAQELVIDPVLAFSTFAGTASNDTLRGVGVDGAGNVYVAGTTLSAGLPRTTGAAFGGSEGTSRIPVGDAFVAKFTPAGALVYLTYLGGEWEDCATAIAVDRAGNAYVAGFTASPNFPTTAGALQQRHAGIGGSLIVRFGDAFVTKLNPTGGQILYSTLLGGSRDDAATAIAIDGAGNAYVGGVTQSVNFPVSENAPQRRLAGIGGQFNFVGLDAPLFQTGDGFVAKLNPAGAALVWASYLGGAQDDLVTSIAVDSTSNVYLAGSTLSPSFPVTAGAHQAEHRGGDSQNITFNSGDGFVTKFNAAGTALIYSTFVGGAGDDVIHGLAVDSAGAAYVAGISSTRNLPVSASAFQRTFQGPNTIAENVHFFGDAFVAKVNAAGSGLAFLTYLGGASDEGAFGLALDPAGNIYVTGFTQSPNFPVTEDAAQARLGQPLSQGGGGDLFFSVLDPTAGRILYSTFLGGRKADCGLGIAVDTQGNAYVAGIARSPDLRGTPRVFQMTPGGGTDGFVARFSGFNAGAANLPVLRSVVNAASNAAGVVAPGMIFVAYGELLGPVNLLGAALDNGRLATARSGVVMRFDGAAAPIVYVSAGQVSGVVPYNVAGKQTVQMTLEYEGRVSAPVTLRVAEAVPALFSANSSGTGPAAALNQDGTFNSVTPAERESVVVLFGTGEGRTNPALGDGSVVASEVRPVLPVSVTVGGQRAEVLYAGSAPGNVVGLFQMNVRLPAGVSGAAPVVVTVGGVASPAGLTLAIR